MKLNNFTDINGNVLTEGDIVDLHQTVNGENLMVLFNLNPLDVRYGYDVNRRYEYDQQELFNLCPISGEVEFEVVGHLELNNLESTNVRDVLKNI